MSAGAHRPTRHLALLALAQVFAMALWFSATAVLPALVEAWSLSASEAAWMTAAVQLGFVVGALTAAALNLADVMPPRRMVVLASVLAGGFNLALAWGVTAAAPAIALRFLTGVCLAGVYPPGMKIAAGHVVSRHRGVAIGLLVGALTLGSAAPHLVAGLLGGAELEYRLVLTVSSGLAVLGALLVGVGVGDGPYAPAPAPFDPRQVGKILRNRPAVLANLGYFGHMWELYGMWAWLAIYLGAAWESVRGARLAAFLIIGVAGSIGAVWAGRVADRVGRTRVTMTAMLISGGCCLLSPLAFVSPPAVLLAFGLIWGAAIIADSAQFSAAITELAEPAYMGTALNLQLSVGFALTLVPIWTLPHLAAWVGWQYAFVALAPGPLLGTLAMAALRRRPESVRLAGGNR